MKIAIYGRQMNEKNLEFMDVLLRELDKFQIEKIIHASFYNYLKQRNGQVSGSDIFTSADDIKERVDFLFSIGGDGTILDTLSLVRNSEIPVVGINTGRLGFLSSISRDKIEFAIESLLKGHYSIDKRALLRLETNTTLFGDVNYALNELTIHKKDSSSMIIIHTYLNGEYLNSYWADGLIIATPTGSTGYSMSCGGPIIAPQSGNFVITPIAPHNLNVRPIVVSDKNIISLEIEGRSQYFLASLDSRSVTINSAVQLAVKREDFQFNLVRIANENFLSTLRNKLNWGLDLRN